MKRLPLLLCLLISAHVLLAQQKYSYEKTIPASGVKKGNVRLEIPVGTLQLNATGSDMLNSKVQYTHSNWKPSMNLNNNNGTVDLKLSQDKVSGSQENVGNSWVVNLGKNIPLALFLQMGAGESKIDLSNSQVQRLEIEAGAASLHVNLGKSAIKIADIKAGVGELNLDLRGNWDHDAAVEVAGGIGDINIKLPKNTGVRLETAGLGSQNLDGLTKEGSYYRNAALGKAKHTLTIKATGGLGSITVMNEK